MELSLQQLTLTDQKTSLTSSTENLRQKLKCLSLAEPDQHLEREVEYIDDQHFHTQQHDDQQRNEQQHDDLQLNDNNTTIHIFTHNNATINNTNSRKKKSNAITNNPHQTAFRSSLHSSLSPNRKTFSITHLTICRSSHHTTRFLIFSKQSSASNNRLISPARSKVNNKTKVCLILTF